MATITVADSMPDQMNRDAAIRKVWWRLIPFRVGNVRHNKMPPPGPPPQAGEGEEICCTTRATREQQHRVRHHRAASTACSLSRLRGGLRWGLLSSRSHRLSANLNSFVFFRLDPITCVRCWN